MKPSPGKSKQSATPPVVPDYSLYEYHWDGPKRLHFPVWQPRQTTLHVVFDGQSARLFSTARILVYHRNRSLGKVAQSSNVWDIQQLGPVIHSFRTQVQDAPPNAFSLPRITVAFEVTVCHPTPTMSSCGILVLTSPDATQELRRNSIHILLEREAPLTPSTMSLALSFTHSTMLCTPIVTGFLEKHTMLASRIEHVTTRIVRVLPPAPSRPRVTDGCLPPELLIKTFEDDELLISANWPTDLLSFAQVCRVWSCAMDVLHSILHFSDDPKSNKPRSLLDVYVLAEALRDKPILGYGFLHFTTNNVGEDWKDVFRRPLRKNPGRFTEALITILGATKNVQRLHLAHLDPRHTDALYTILQRLRGMQTFSVGEVEEELVWFLKNHRSDGETRLLSVIQLARCMAIWPALKCLKVHHLHPGIFGIWRFALRPPLCALTQLTISRSHICDKDLTHLFGSSVKTLERVELDRIEGITNVGLLAFLVAISQNVVYLTVQDVALPPFRQWGNLLIGRTERALDTVVDKMIRLRELRISGDVASEFMLDRRSKMFVAHDMSDETQLPVIQLWVEDVPRLCGFAADEKWPGWCTPAKIPHEIY